MTDAKNSPGRGLVTILRLVVHGWALTQWTASCTKKAIAAYGYRPRNGSDVLANRSEHTFALILWAE